MNGKEIEIDTKLLSELQKVIICKFVTQDELMENLGCTKTQLRYKISKMNTYLRNNHLPELSIKNGKVYSFCTIEDIISKVPKNPISFKKMIGYLASDERIYLECILIFCSKKPLGAKQLFYIFQVSRNSILNDLKKLKKMIAQHDLKLEYSRQRGYYFEGLGKNIRSLIFFCIYHVRKNLFFLDVISQLLETPDFKTIFETTRESLKEILEKNNIQYIEEYYEQVSCMIAFLQFYCQSPNYQTIEIHEEELYDNSYYAIANNLNNALPIPLPLEEVKYLEVLLLCICYDLKLLKKLMVNKLPMMKLIAKELINRFVYIVNVKIEIHQNPINDLLTHLLFSYFRMSYGFYIVNPFLNNIMKYHGDIFNIVLMIIRNMNYFDDLVINDHEVGYIVMYLVTLLDVSDDSRHFSALVVCTRGRGVASLLIRKLIGIFPDFDFECAYDLKDDVLRNQTKYDVIFTTVDVSGKLDKPHFNVSRLISDFTFDVNELKEQVNNALRSKVSSLQSLTMSSDDLVAMIKPYCDIQDMNGLRNTLSDISIILNNHTMSYQYTQPSLKQCLAPEHINVTENIHDWKAAIKLSAIPLIKSGYINPHYVDACIQLVMQKGAYIIIYPLISMPHAYSKDGVNQMSMSLLNISSPVNLIDNPKYPVQIFIMLAAVDDKQHVKALGELAKILSDTERRHQLIASRTKEAMMDVLFAI